MKICFVAVNAKYIHTAPAVRILNKIVKEKYESDFFEFTIKDNIDNIINVIKDYDIIGLSCYIWNIDIMVKLSEEIKLRYKEKIIFSGGPEVSYDTINFVNKFDYVMSGEGEEIIIPFIDYLHGKCDIPEGVASINKPNVIAQYVKDLSNIPDILDTYTEDDKKNRIVYVETTRGCPFKCSYCLSSVEKGVRFFSDDYIKHLFDYIINNDFKCIKFLDRTFNVNPSRFLKICKILESTKNTYQFEIAAELFNEEVVDYFKNKVTPNKFRLEIGLQSLMKEALCAVDRNSDVSKILKVINQINEGNRVVIHVDLIAGLPFETLNVFKETFNYTFKLLCDELQLGFLKLLRGTKIRNEAQIYDYKFTSDAPYEVLSNKFISNDELNIIHKCEDALEWMWNHKRCHSLLNHLVKDDVIENYFDFFVCAYDYYDKSKQLYENYSGICDFLRDIGLYKKEYIDDLKIDYLSTVLVKPKPFWELENSLDYYRKLLGYDTEDTNNYFITPYYDKYIVIKYEKNKKPQLIIQ